tara:strand:- start:24 stop:230 length:207 start_codon:yes stop_codon:yes gene_type:complete
MKNIFERKIYIQTEYAEEHIDALENANVPYVLVSKIVAVTWARLGYITYSVILDFIVLSGIIYYFFVA